MSKEKQGREMCRLIYGVFFTIILTFCFCVHAVPPVADDKDVTVADPDSAVIELIATDHDGLPDPPGELIYIITSLPEHGWLFDPGDGLEIIEADIPYTLQNDANSVIYEPCKYYFDGKDDFTFKANDGGSDPNDGDSNIANVKLTMNMLKSVTFGTGDDAFYFPFRFQSKKTRTQLIYLAEEIGNTAKIISAIALNVESHLYDVPEHDFENWTIRMQHVDVNEFPASAVFINDGWGPAVYEANEPNLSAGWNTFELETPFEYDGVQNLLVDLIFNNREIPPSAKNGYVYQSNMGQKRKIFYYTDDGTDPMSWENPTTQLAKYTNHVCDMKFTSQPHNDVLHSDFNYNCSVGFEDLLTMVNVWLDDNNDVCDISIDKDKKVNLADFAILASEWLESMVPVVLSADFDGNGLVDLEDLRTMIDTWLAQDGDGNYNSACDISVIEDQKVDLADFVILASEWQATM